MEIATRSYSGLILRAKIRRDRAMNSPRRRDAPRGNRIESYRVALDRFGSHFVTPLRDPLFFLTFEQRKLSIIRIIRVINILLKIGKREQTHGESSLKYLARCCLKE